MKFGTVPREIRLLEKLWNRSNSPLAGIQPGIFLFFSPLFTSEKSAPATKLKDACFLVSETISRIFLSSPWSREIFGNLVRILNGRRDVYYIKRRNFILILIDCRIEFQCLIIKNREFNSKNSFETLLSVLSQ